MKRQLSAKLFTHRSLAIVVSIVVGLSLVSINHKLQAQSINDLRSRSQQLEDDINNNQAAANKKHKHAESLEEAIGELDGEISNATAQINDTAGKINQLTSDLKQKQKELVRAKKLLKINMEALYKRGDASTVELIVGSDSFSEFIDEQEYLERIKTGIQDAAKKVIKLKKQIKSQRDQKQEELQKQEAAKSSLGSLRSQRADLLEKTRGEEAEYKKVVNNLEAQRAAVDQEITNLILAAARRNAASNSSGGGSGGGVVGSGGHIIGRVGSTGFSTGPHLHFEMRNSSGQTIDPRGSMGAWPVSGYVSQEYGCVAPYSWYHIKCSGGRSLHPGLDIVAAYGAPVRATKPGTIIFQGWDGAYGNKVVIQHNDGTFSVYAHLSSF